MRKQIGRANKPKPTITLGERPKKQSTPTKMLVTITAKTNELIM
jgi:hypothetical protein